MSVRLQNSSFAPHKNHENGPNNSRTRLQLPRATQTQFALAEAYVVALHNRPFIIMSVTARYGPSVPINEEIDPKSHLPSKITVINAVHELSLSLRKVLKVNLDTEPLRFGGAITVDGVQLKVKGVHYYDFRAHYTESIEKPTFDKVDFHIGPNTFTGRGTIGVESSKHPFDA